MLIEWVALATVLSPMTSMADSLHPLEKLVLTGSDKNSPTLLIPSIGVNHTQDATLSLTIKNTVDSTSFDDPVLNLPISIYLPHLLP